MKGLILDDLTRDVDSQTNVWYPDRMLGEGGTPLSRLQAAAREFQAREDRRVDLKGLRAVIDALEGEFAAESRDAQKSGDHLVNGNITAASWISRTCAMSVTSAADRLCVGEQLAALPRIAAGRDRLPVHLRPLPPARAARRQARSLRRGGDARLRPPVLGLPPAHALPRRQARRRLGRLLQ